MIVFAVDRDSLYIKREYAVCLDCLKHLLFSNFIHSPMLGNIYNKVCLKNLS